MKDYYFILGVPPTAKPDEIKEAFRKLCLRYHPDRTVLNSYATERYMGICEAYRVLSHSDRKLIYDKRLARLQRKTSKNSAAKASLKDAIFPELKVSYKGHYPWLAIFAIVIVSCIAVIFLYSHKATPKSKVDPIYFAAIPLTEPRRNDSSQVALPDFEAIKAFILATLKANTPHVIFESLDNDTSHASRFSYREQSYNYRFKGHKLIITYTIGYKSLHIRKKVSIPYRDVSQVYLYKQHLWICNNKESISEVNLGTGYTYNTSFFSVKFDNDPQTEAGLVKAFAQLKMF